MHHSVKKRKYIGGKVKVYDNVDSDGFSVPEVKNYCAKLGVLDYVQFYYLMPGLDLDNGLRYLSTDGDTHELFERERDKQKSTITTEYQNIKKREGTYAWNVHEHVTCKRNCIMGSIPI